MLLAQPWWSYATVSIGFFAVCLGLNYVAKKLNEARMGERLVRVLEKSPVRQSTHVNAPVITVPSEGEPRAISMRPPQPYSPPPISLIFDKEDNKRVGDVYNMVKPLTDRNYGDPSLTSNTKSLETINVLPISSDHTVGEFSPIKKIECELITAKATSSSHKFSEKVLIKDKIDSYDQITPKNSPERNPPDIPGIAGCNTNSVTTKEPGSVIIGGTLLNDTVAENNSFSNICDGRIVPTNNYTVENTVKNTKVIKDKKSREKIDTGCLDSHKSKNTNLKNIDDNPLYTTEKSANNMIIAKSSSSHSGSIRNETKITSIEKKESSCITAKESSHTHSNRAGENIPVKTSKSEQIVPKETLFDAQNENHVSEYVSMRNNIIMNSSANKRSHYNVTESVPIKNTECGPVLAKASYMDKINSSDLPDYSGLVTVKNRLEQISGTLPCTGKDPYTSKLISENSICENIPLKNISASRIFPTNTSITEIAVKGPKIVRDKKSNEEIDTRCLDGIKSKIVIFKDMNDGTRAETSGTLSNHNVTKISSVEKMESKEISPDTQFKRHLREYASIRNSVKDEYRVIEFKTKPSNERSSSNVTEYVPIKTSEPGRIVARQTALLTRSDTNVTVLGQVLENAAGHIVAEATTPSLTQSPVRTSEFGFLAAEKTFNRQSDDNVLDTYIATPPNTQSEITLSKDGSIKKKESGSINVKETSIIQTEVNVPDKDIVQMDVPRRTAVEEKSLKKLVSANNCIEVVTIRTSRSGSIVARETSSRTLSGPDALNPIKTSASGSIAAEEIYNRQNDASAVKEESSSELVSSNNTTDCVMIKSSESGSIVARETATLAVSGPEVLNSIRIKMSESGSLSKIQSEDPFQYE